MIREVYGFIGLDRLTAKLIEVKFDISDWISMIKLNESALIVTEECMKITDIKEDVESSKFCLEEITFNVFLPELTNIYS